jgi:hypothetical protein
MVMGNKSFGRGIHVVAPIQRAAPRLLDVRCKEQKIPVLNELPLAQAREQADTDQQ